MGKISVGLKQTFDDYCSLTSTHGIPHVGQSTFYLTKPVISKIFWFIITACSAGGFLYQFIFQLLRLYFSYPVNVDTTVKFHIRNYKLDLFLDRIWTESFPGCDFLHAQPLENFENFRDSFRRPRNLMIHKFNSKFYRSMPT